MVAPIKLQIAESIEVRSILRRVAQTVEAQREARGKQVGNILRGGHGRGKLFWRVKQGCASVARRPACRSRVHYKFVGGHDDLDVDHRLQAGGKSARAAHLGGGQRATGDERHQRVCLNQSFTGQAYASPSRNTRALSVGPATQAKWKTKRKMAMEGAQGGVHHILHSTMAVYAHSSTPEHSCSTLSMAVVTTPSVAGAWGRTN